MSKTLQEYAAWLDDRKLLWPAAPDVVPAKATPYLKPLGGIRAVLWNVYGTLLRITDGKLLPVHPQQVRMQVALEKTIHEFNMWNSMSRKPGQPWEYMLQLYTREVENLQMKASPRKGEAPEVNTAEIWKGIIEKLGKKEYSWDEDDLGDIEDYTEKIAWFFQSSLQGVAANPNAMQALSLVYGAGFMQGLCSNAQPFTIAQLLRALNPGGPPPMLGDLFLPSITCQSYRVGVKQPSSLLMEESVEQLDRQGVTPRETAYIGSRVHDELAPAKKLGFRTVLYAADKNSLQASSADMKDEKVRPDRIITDLLQVRDLLIPDPDES